MIEASTQEPNDKKESVWYPSPLLAANRAPWGPMAAMVKLYRLAILKFLYADVSVNSTCRPKAAIHRQRQVRQSHTRTPTRYLNERRRNLLGELYQAKERPRCTSSQTHAISHPELYVAMLQ